MLRVPPDRLSRRQWLLSSGALASAAARPQPASRANLNIYFGDLHNHANVGVYASVLQGGAIHRGDSVSLE